jgi:hypothetical protein
VGKPSLVIHSGEDFLSAQSTKVDRYGPAMAPVENLFLSQAREATLRGGLSKTFAPDAFPYLAPQPTLNLAGACVEGQESLRRVRRKSGVCRQPH